MMYLTKEELVKNIAEQTERAMAVIEHTDFTSGRFNPNTVIIPFLSNIADSALIVIALEDNADSESDCHRKAFELVMRSLKVKDTTKNFIRKISELRRRYTAEYTQSDFDSGECLDFLNAYDCFMFEFIKSSPAVQENGSIKFSSFRNKVIKLLKKSETAESGDISEDKLSGLLSRNNSLLEEILRENQRINKKLDDIIKIINGGRI